MSEPMSSLLQYLGAVVFGLLFSRAFFNLAKEEEGKGMKYFYLFASYALLVGAILFAVTIGRYTALNF